MSNAIDILVVGGPANGKQICMQREHQVPLLGFVAEGVGEVTYTRRKWLHPTTGKLYHIAARDEDAVTDEQIIVEITMANFGPAWDLNR
jgi:hypothetical protein